MDSDDDDLSMFVPPRPELSFPVLPQPKNKKSTQVPWDGLSKLVPKVPAWAGPPIYPFADAVLRNPGRLIVSNMSLERQSFVLFPSKPTIPGLDAKSVRLGVFQSSNLVDKLSGEQGTFGSVPFKLPFGKPLNWANPAATPGLIVVAGTESTSGDPSGVGEFDSVPERTAWTLLPYSDSGTTQANTTCVMSMPPGSEPCFLDSQEVAAKNYPLLSVLNPGSIIIKTEDLDSSNRALRPFVGIGVIDPKYPDLIIPVITWVVQANRTYQIEPDMGTWQLATGQPCAPGTIVDPALFSNVKPVTFGAPPSQPVEVYLQVDNTFVTMM